MGLFSRRSAPRVPDTPPDPIFSYWDQVTADEFRALVGSTFAELGITAQVGAREVVIQGQPGVLGLDNLAALCHGDERGRSAWPGLVRRHVLTMLSTMGPTTVWDRMTDDEILAATYCRVIPSAGLMPSLTYPRSIGAGLHVALNLDQPETVHFFTDQQVDRYGHDALLAAGIANLGRVVPDEHRVLERDGARIEVLLGGSVFTASLLLVLGDVLRSVGLELDPQAGALVAVPNRNQLLVHLPRGRTPSSALELMADFTAAGFRDAVGPVSPCVYWWRPQGLEQVSTLDGDGTHLTVSADLAVVLGLT